MLRKITTTFKPARFYSTAIKSKSEIRAEIDKDLDERYRKYRDIYPVDGIYDLSSEKREETLGQIVVFHEIYREKLRHKIMGIFSYMIGTILGCIAYDQYKKYMNSKKKEVE